MQITFVTRKFGNVERNSHCDVLHSTPVRVARLFLDCNGIGVNRPAFGGTVPYFHQMSRGPAKSADVPHFSKMVLYFFPLPII